MATIATKATNERIGSAGQTTVIAADDGDRHVNTGRQAAASAAVVAPARRFAIAAGVCYLITHVTSVAAPVLYDPILNNAGYIVGSGPDTGVLVGAFFDIICALGIIGTAVALYPVVRKQNEGGALGYVGLRTLEAGIIVVGAISLLAVVTLRQQVAGMAGTAGTTGAASTDTATLLSLGSAFVGSYRWTALVGPGLVCGVNTVVMAYLMYRSRLVPRFIPVLGLIGGPLVFAYSTAKMFGASDQILSWAAIGVVPIFTWEVTLALYLITRGFKPSALAAMNSRSADPQANELLSAA